MHGAHLTSHRLEPLIIEQPIGFKVKNEEDWLSIKDGLSSWLYTANPAPLEFEDEPGRIYYAVVQNTIDDLERMAWLREGTIQFLCADPFAYGRQQRHALLSGGVTTLANEGTADTYPVIDLTVKETSSRIEIASHSNLTKSNTPRSIVLGDLEEIGEEPVEREKLIMHDTMKSTNVWVGASSVDSGYVSGQMAANFEGFYVEQWGDEGSEEGLKSDWIGPSLQRAFTHPLDSFCADIYVSNRNYKDAAGTLIPRAVGIIEVYMRDINGHMVCKIQFGDINGKASANQGVFASAGKTKVAKSSPANAWNDFNGILRIMRDSGYFYPYIAAIDKNGKHVNIREMGRVIPGPSVGTNEVTTIQVAIRKWAGAKQMYQCIKEIKVYDMIGEFEYPDYSPKLDFKLGDRLQIDTARSSVLLNGERRNDVINLDTEFFSLVEGLNRLEVSGNIEGTVTFRNRYL